MKKANAKQVQANVESSVQVPEIVEKKPSGARRIANLEALHIAVNGFKWALPDNAVIDAAIKKANNVKLLKGDASLTQYGHTAIDANGKRALTAVIDDTINDVLAGKAINIARIFKRLGDFITNTSRVNGAPFEYQVYHTFVKYISHLKGFGVSKPHFNNYLNKRLTTKGYTPAKRQQIFNEYGDLAVILRRAMTSARDDWRAKHKTVIDAEIAKNKKA